MARLLFTPSDLPTATDPLHDVTCLLCSRVACQIKADGARERIPSRDLPIDPPARIGRPRWEHHDAHRFNASHAGRLVALLADGVSRHRADILASLGVTSDVLKGAIDRARAAGHDVVHRGQGFYRLEGVRP